MGTILGIWVVPWSTLVAQAQGLEVAAGTGVFVHYVYIFSPEIFLVDILGENYALLGYVGLIVVLIVGIVITGALRLKYLKNREAKA